jgi:hypothetical protein
MQKRMGKVREVVTRSVAARDLDTLPFRINDSGVNGLTACFRKRWLGDVHLHGTRRWHPDGRWFREVRSALVSQSSGQLEPVQQCYFGPAVDKLKIITSENDTQTFRRSRGLFLARQTNVPADDGRKIPCTQHVDDAGKKGAPAPAADKHAEIFRASFRLGSGNHKVALGRGEGAAAVTKQQRPRTCAHTPHGNDEKLAAVEASRTAAARRRLLLRRHNPAVIAFEEVNRRTHHR